MMDLFGRHGRQADARKGRRPTAVIRFAFAAPRTRHTAIERNQGNSMSIVVPDSPATLAILEERI
eukprot:scaffold286_cov169-Amphora_coffeaeformis.AAC.29